MIRSTVGRTVGALVGAELDRQRGQNGLKGALVGALAAGVMRRMGPFGLVLGGAYVAKKAFDRRREARPAV